MCVYDLVPMLNYVATMFMNFSNHTHQFKIVMLYFILLTHVFVCILSITIYLQERFDDCAPGLHRPCVVL